MAESAKKYDLVVSRVIAIGRFTSGLENRNLGLAEDAYCKVDPDSEGPIGIGPLKVLCNMTNHDQAITVINQSRVGPQLISSSPSLHPPNKIPR